MLEIPLFLVYAILAIVLTSIMSSIVGSLIVLKGSTFYVSAVAHAALAGAALGILLGFPMYYGAFLFGFLGSVGLAYASKLGKAQEEAAIGVFFSTSMSLAVILVYMIRDYALKAWSLLLGDPLSVSYEDLVFMIVLVAGALLIFVLYRERLILASLDPEGSEALGIGPLKVNFVVYLLATLAVIVALRTVGMILAYAILIVPPATAAMLSRGTREFFTKALALSLGLSLLSLPVGYGLSVPISGLIGILLTVAYAIAFVSARAR